MRKTRCINVFTVTAFLNKADLEAHLEQLEEAKKRDHNKLGRELELFTTVDYIDQIFLLCFQRVQE